MTVLVAFATGGAAGMRGAETGVTIDRLAVENRQLQEQVRKQQDTIDELSNRLNQLLRATEQQQRDLKGLQDRVDSAAPVTPSTVADRAHEVRVAGEAGLAFFHTGKDGPFPNSEFRVDDPVLSVEAPVWRDTYVFGELKLLTREANNDAFQLGEFYVDCENVSQLWGRPGQLSLRAGRINTPFGEEYQVRTPAANPLISHSLSDVWGTDEGIEIYGSLGALRYVLAVQNGGVSRLHDYNADKALVGRLTWDPVSWLRLSGSAMRTGELAPADNLSDLWFANGFFRSIGSSTGTTAFWADLCEGDASARWKTGHLAVAAGAVRYDDNDRAAENARRMQYGYVELVQGIADKLYGAARYSEIRSAHGYPMVGSGTAGEYFFRPSLTQQLRRFSLGVGYRFADPLVLKFEYSWNTGHLLGGKAREDENFFGSEIGLKF
jgi:uncharacterized coiled-coil protein SlyX